MVVWRHHGTEPPQTDLDDMVAELTRAADVCSGRGTGRVDFVMRQIPDHFHAHARDPHWWVRRLVASVEQARISFSRS